MKSKYSFSILLMLICFSSCKEFLETVPSDTLSPSNYYETEEQLNQALMGVYDIMATAPLYGGEMLGRMGLEADEGFHNRTAQKTNVHVYDVPVSDPSVEAFYKSFYDGINRANYLLANVNKAPVGQEKRNIIEGEALFLRAYYHFMLVQYFGDIPLRTSPTLSAKEGEIVRTPAKQVYEQIIADMTRAEELLKNRTATAVGKPGRINLSTVRGILARVCLHMAGHPVKDETKYAEARRWAKLVIDSKEHELNPSYEQVFINMSSDRYDIKESIWEVEFWGNGSTAFVELGRVGSNNGVTYTSEPQDPTMGYSYGFLSTTERHFKMYAPSDLRRDWTISTYSVSGNPAVKKAWTTAQILNRNSAKWRREYEPYATKAKNGGSINFPLLRYSDVLLMFAEADNFVNNGPSEDAINAVNDVRKRAAAIGGVKTIQLTSGGANYTAVPTVTVNGGGGTGAIAVATINTTTKTVSGITVFTSGKGYTTMPTISITGGGGTGATATVTALTTVQDAELTSAQTASKEAFLEMLQEERSRELAFEGLRKMDLVRWGIFLTNMKRIAADFTSPHLSAYKDFALSYNNASARDVLWPIPVREMGLNRNWDQNFGW